jgi:hypothetical protein
MVHDLCRGIMIEGWVTFQKTAIFITHFCPEIKI